MKDVVFLSVKDGVPPDSYWDMNMLKEILSSCKFHYEMGNLTKAIVIIPGSKQADCVERINMELAKLSECKVIITSDEENLFPIDDLRHDNMKIYSQCPTDKFKPNIKWLPIGAPNTRTPEVVNKEIPMFFAGQVTHEDRKNCIRVLRGMKGVVVETEGFTQGIKQPEYYEYLDRTQLAPCPNGAVSPDSFRLYEALESGCVPVVNYSDGFWDKLFVEYPFPNVSNWEGLKGVEYTDDQAIQCQSWWKRKKKEIQWELLGQSDTSVVIPVSPIKSHPSTEILDETIASIKDQLPNADIFVTFDGVRSEHLNRKADYHKFIRSIIAKHDVYPLVFNDHTHQVGMMRHVIEKLGNYIVYVEQDTPFTDDYINWQACKVMIDSEPVSPVDLVRFHFEAVIPEPHKYLMLNELPYNKNLKFLVTKQWSQRPHITTKNFYKKVLNNFSDNALSFIEDKMHSVAQDFPDEYSLSIYHPEGSIKRTYHTDGRAGEKKYDETQVF